jgi:hypothetical protein
MISSRNSIERRREPRYAIDSYACVESDVAGKVIGRIMDISDHGMRMQVSEVPLRLGETIQIRVQNELIHAKLRHFRTDGMSYTIGVELDERLNSGQMQAVLCEVPGSTEKWIRL